jgi:hypothetical protein
MIYYVNDEQYDYEDPNDELWGGETFDLDEDYDGPDDTLWTSDPLWHGWTPA